MPVIPAVSAELLYVRNIKAFDAASPDAATDPTTLAASLAFTARGVAPASGDWHAAAWENQTTLRLLVGTGGVVLTAGSYDIWLRITGGTEVPERRISVLEVE